MNIHTLYNRDEIIKKQLLRLPDVLKMYPVSRATLYRRIAEGKFPRQVKDGRCTFWRATDVIAAINALSAQ